MAELNGCEEAKAKLEMERIDDESMILCLRSNVVEIKQEKDDLLHVISQRDAKIMQKAEEIEEHLAVIEKMRHEMEKQKKNYIRLEVELKNAQ